MLSKAEEAFLPKEEEEEEKEEEIEDDTTSYCSEYSATNSPPDEPPNFQLTYWMYLKTLLLIRFGDSWSQNQFCQSMIPNKITVFVYPFFLEHSRETVRIELLNSEEKTLCISCTQPSNLIGRMEIESADKILAFYTSPSNYCCNCKRPLYAVLPNLNDLLNV